MFNREKNVFYYLNKIKLPIINVYRSLLPD